MKALRIQRHGRIQEWVAEEIGAFDAVGLAYEIEHPEIDNSALPPNYGRLVDAQSLEQDSAYRDFVIESSAQNVVSTSHWAVSTAIGSGYGENWPGAYSIMPAGIYVAPSSNISTLSQLHGVPLVVGRHSGSHFSALYALQNLLPASGINLKFVAGRSNRLRQLLDDPTLAGSTYGLEAYILEQRGYRKIIDTSFIVSFMLVNKPALNDVEKYFEALRLAQTEIDINPNRYKHFLTCGFSKDVQDMVDVTACGIGERLIFSPYSHEVSRRTRDWVVGQGILPHSWI
jgi:NitT/TauT family transport system substrate-binding protein